MRPTKKITLSLAIAISTIAAQAETATNDVEQRKIIAEQLQQLQQMRSQLSDQMNEFDRRIRDLEKSLGVTDSTTLAPAYQQKAVTASTTRPDTQASTPTDESSMHGRYEPGKGFVLARTPVGEVDFSVFTYARYLNQKDLDDDYTDSFGRAKTIDQRNDMQFQKLTLNFKGWLFDPRFRYLFYTWTSNTSQGDGAQVVVAGNLGFQFDKAFNLYTGIGALPSTRSTNYTFPNWLKNDHRTIADEFFRGSYTSGIWANGEIQPGLKYRAMLGNNLSQLGVSATQLDDGFNTVSGALWWMPTTGEYGPGEGLGDYEFHQDVATLFGIHFTQSYEDAQGQSEEEGFENSQIRLSDGTLLFSTDPFMTGGDIRKATYQMAALNGGFKYQGWSLEAEYYHRWVDNFSATGPLPVSSLEDEGFQLQGSTMVIDKTLQAYAAYSKIQGEYGNPSDFTLGLNWFPFMRKEVRMSVQGLYLDDSPVGYSSVPFAVGGNGWVFSTDLIVAF